MNIEHILSPSYQVCTHHAINQRQFHGIYASDLLSRVIKNAQPDDLLITTINHINTVATATMVDLAAIIVCEDQTPTPTMIKRSEEANIALIKTPLKTHEVIIDLYRRGLI